MSPNGITSTLFSLFQSKQSGSTVQSALGGIGLNDAANGENFSSSLAVRMATLEAQSVSLLLGSTANGDKTSSILDFLANVNNSTSSSSSVLQGLSTNGRNLSLFDPESAYQMMSDINNKDVAYKAQFSELSEMKTAVSGMQQAGLMLSSVSETTENEAIKTQLQAFAKKYNEWIQRFDGTVKSDGVLAGTQAAEISLYELEQSVENIFNGAKDGFHGLSDLGLTIDQNTNLASLDASKLEAALATNKKGAVNTIDEFSANFAKSAELLNSTNNFIPNRLNNLDRVIDYIADNKASLQAEFGLGDLARPSAQIAKALTTYEQVYSL